MARRGVPGDRQQSQQGARGRTSPLAVWEHSAARRTLTLLQGATSSAAPGEAPGTPFATRAVLTPARDFWMFSLALAMSRRITLAPFSCRWCRKNNAFI